jgi:hypothetical protein
MTIRIFTVWKYKILQYVMLFDFVMFPYCNTHARIMDFFSRGLPVPSRAYANFIPRIRVLLISGFPRDADKHCYLNESLFSCILWCVELPVKRTLLCHLLAIKVNVSRPYFLTYLLTELSPSCEDANCAAT